MTALSFTRGPPPCNKLLKLVYSDVVGPTRIHAKNGARFFVTFIDDSSRWCEVYFLSHKSGVFKAFKMYKAHVERQTGSKILSFQSDNGKEYCNQDFNILLTDHGIERRLTVPYTAQQNGTAERMNRTLLDMARCLLLQSGLPSTFWAEAVATACYIRNSCPTSILQGLTPYEVWNGEPPRLNYMKSFGSIVYVLNKNPAKDKFEARSNKGIFIGYPRESKGYRIWLCHSKKIVIARDVKFLNETVDVSKNLNEFDFIHESNEESFIESENNETPTMDFETTSIHPISPTEEEEREEEDYMDATSTARGRGRPKILRTGNRGRPRKLYHPSHNTGTVESEIPIRIIDDEENNVFAAPAEVSVSEAIDSKERDEWNNAIQSEVKSLLKNNTIDIIIKNKDQNIIGSRWVLTNKYGLDGSIKRRKARIVAKGYSQRYGVDYYQTFAPVARLETIRLLMAISVQYKLQIHQIDVVTAYLNAQLDEEVIMEIPELMKETLEKIASTEEKDLSVTLQANKMLKSLRSGGNACKLNKALYGLRQSGRQWYSTLGEKLRSLKLNPTKGDPCLYVAHRGTEILLLVIYVDDILIASRNLNWIKEIKSSLKESYEIKDLGLAEFCLGLEINQQDEIITVTQSGYILDILRRFGMENCNPISTPAELNSIQIQPIKSTEMENCPYRELIGALLYLSVATRPDIANTVSRLAQFTTAPTKDHWIAAKRILRYLAGTVQMGLVYKKLNQPISGYSDADWGGDFIDRKSYSGYAFLMSGAAVTWKSQKQRSVALSSTEAEYVSLSEAVKEALYLRSLVLEIKLNELAQIIIYIDNRGAQFLANDPVSHTRLKHIDIRYHFTRETVQNGIIKLHHVSSELMIADILTKALPRIKHNRCIKDLGLKMIKSTQSK